MGKTDIDADEDQNIEELVEEGELCLRILDIVEPVYTLLVRGTIPYPEYRERVELLIAREAEHSPKNTSFDIRSSPDTSHLTPSHLTSQVGQVPPSQASLNVQSQARQ